MPLAVISPEIKALKTSISALLGLLGKALVAAQWGFCGQGGTWPNQGAGNS